MEEPEKNTSVLHNYWFWCVPSKAAFCSLQLWPETYKYLLGYNFKAWLHLFYVVVLLCLDKHFPFLLDSLVSPSMCHRLLPLRFFSQLLHCYANALLALEKQRFCLSPCPVLGTNLIFILWNTCANFLSDTEYFQGSSVTLGSSQEETPNYCRHEAFHQDFKLIFSDFKVVGISK